MNKRVIIISISIIILLVVVIVVSYIITKNSNLGDNKISDIQESPLVSSEEKKDISIDKNECKEINKDSVLARDIFDFVPKYLQNVTDKMSSEYIIYSAISKLEEKQTPTANYIIGEGEFPGYKSELVEQAAKKIYGNSIQIEKKDSYNLPIGYSSKDDAFCKYAMGFGLTEEFQVIKELKENEKTYKLTIYALSIAYDEDNKLYISTKDTYNLYKSQEMDEDIIRKSMKEFTLNGIEIDPTSIANEYKSDLPLIEYELEKLDDRGTKYFVKNIKFIFD